MQPWWAEEPQSFEVLYVQGSLFYVRLKVVLPWLLLWWVAGLRFPASSSRQEWWRGYMLRPLTQDYLWIPRETQTHGSLTNTWKTDQSKSWNYRLVCVLKKDTNKLSHRPYLAEQRLVSETRPYQEWQMLWGD